MSIPRMMPSRTIAIGDIHGHADVLKRLLTQVQPTASDAIVFLGDYINRGPDSRGVVDAILALKGGCNVRCVYGNHEEMLVQARHGGKDDVHYWETFGGLATAKSYGESGRYAASKIFANNPAHADFYLNLLPFYETDSHVFVHASYDPSRGGDQHGDVLRWTRFGKYPPPVKTLICGHSPQKSLLPCFQERQICIDTGCGVFKDGRLTAMDVHTQDIWQENVDA